MKIPFRQHQLVIQVETVAPQVDWDSALDGATDREIEHFARSTKTAQEPRWDAQALIYGFRL